MNDDEHLKGSDSRPSAKFGTKFSHARSRAVHGSGAGAIMFGSGFTNYKPEPNISPVGQKVTNPFLPNALSFLTNPCVGLMQARLSDYGLSKIDLRER